ncbi:MAG: hypothetical protein J1E34_03750 [Oscillospiraceae bacterium]|nr:hypothetical protein [Oscillospiraceae bacterium]
MKKIIRAVLASILCIFLMMSLSSCEMIKNIKERARLASELKILDSPEDSALADEFALALKGALEKNEGITEVVRIGVNKPSVEADGSEADILKSAANMLKNLIVTDNLGSPEREITPDMISETLLKNIENADILSASSTRNTRNEPVTDENGKEVTNENGEVVKEKVVYDNLLNIIFNFYTENTVTETNENGEEKEVKEIIPADSDIIEKYFGNLPDKKDMISEFDVIKEYFQINDYDVEYTDCRIQVQTDMDADELTFVSYLKNFKVTASVTGVGPFSEMGEITVTFTGTENTTYNFKYPLAEI